MKQQMTDTSGIPSGPSHNWTERRTKTVRCLAILLWVAVLPLAAQARDIVDMNGRTVTLPETISKVVAVSPPGTYLLYAIDPRLIGGLNFPLWQNEKKYTIKDYGKLPVIGGLAGQSRNINREVLLQVKPDFIVYWSWKDDAISNKFLESLAPLHFPLVSVRLNSINDYPEALRFLADAVNRKERGEALSKYAIDALSEARTISARIPDDKKITVYYAEGTDGLSTEPAGSLHAELIPLAGGINVHKGEALDHYGMEKISMEQLLLYDPEIILIKEKTFFDTVYSEPRWKNLRAVRNKHVYLIPYVPFNWFDRPPSYMRLLGIKWLLNTLHPDFYTIDMVAEAKAFYKLFLGVDLTDKDTLEILNR
jgi:iron complex transport system substrate-binding protein